MARNDLLREVLEDVIHALDSLADLLADSEDILVGQTDAAERINQLLNELNEVRKAVGPVAGPGLGGAGH